MKSSPTRPQRPGRRDRVLCLLLGHSVSRKPFDRYFTPPLHWCTRCGYPIRRVLGFWLVKRPLGYAWRITRHRTESANLARLSSSKEK